MLHTDKQTDKRRQTHIPPGGGQLQQTQKSESEKHRERFS